MKPLLCGIMALAIWGPYCTAQHFSFSEPGAGMNNLNVDCMVQDRSGYLWVGTENGLFRYDGSQFRKYDSADGLNGRTIQNLYADGDGTLLVGTTTGIYFQLANGNFAEIHAPDRLNRFSQQIGTEFAALGPGRVVATDRSGAFVLQRTGQDKWDAEELPLEPGQISSVLSLPNGELWYGCETDLCRFKDGKTTHLGAAWHLPAEQWQHLLLTHEGHIWMRGPEHLGEVVPSEGRYVSHDLPGRSNAEPYDQLILDAQGRVTASQGAMFGIWEKQGWRMVTARNGLATFDISALFVDREGSLWIGTVGHGLMRWVGEDRWEALTKTEGLSDDIVWATLRDKRGRLWVGTESGLDWVAPGGEAATPWKSGNIETPRAVSLAESEDGSIWLGSAAGKLVRIDEKTLSGRAWAMPEVFRVLYDGAHRLWVATAAGLYVLDTTGRTPEPRLVEDSAIANEKARFTDLNMDGANQLWAASDEGLYRLNANGWRKIDQGLVGASLALIAPDAKGNVWAAGNFPGIFRFRVDGDRIVESEHVAKPRLLSEQVVSLFVDRRGWLWVGQDEGATVFSGKTWRHFTQDDGLIWNDIDSNGIGEDSDGSMWIGTSGGLSHLMRPEKVPVIAPQTPAISRIEFGSTMLADGAKVAWSESPLSISMAALSFRDASHIRLRYRLLGLESEWVESSEERVRYPRLEPGSYRFQVETVDIAGGATSAVTELDFRITPRWWQSVELRVALGLLVLLALWLVWRWRVHLLMGQKRQLELAVQNRTDDLQREKAELLRAREQMRHFAEHDDLTGLWNHRIIIERLRGEVDRSRRETVPLSLILVDLDHFKKINDTYGHPAGDLVLKEIGAVFLRSVRSYDWVGRYGGEEFLLILPGTNLASAKVRAEHLRLAVQLAPIKNGDTAIKVTASFGVVSGFATDYESLLHEADAALYRAKDAGRNCVVASEVEPPEYISGAVRREL